MAGLAKALIVALGLTLCASVATASPAPEAATERAAEAVTGHDEPPPPINWLDFSYSDEDPEGGTLEKGEEAKAPPFVLMLLNFGLLLVILGWKAKPALGNYADKRHRQIKSALDEASRLRAEAEEKLAEYKQRIAKVDAEVDAIIADIRADAEAEKRRIIAGAEAQAQTLKRDAENRIAAELSRARDNLSREVVLAAIAAAQGLIEKNTSAADRNAALDSFLADLEDAPDTATEDKN